MLIVVEEAFFQSGKKADNGGAGGLVIDEVELAIRVAREIKVGPSGNSFRSQ
jgi:hypothetical protein